MAQQVALKAVTGRELGSSSSRRLRREGMIPAVVYGLEAEPVPVAVEYAEARVALTTDAGINALLNVDIEGSSELCLVKEVQRHVVRDEVTHIDFIRVDPNAQIELEVPLVLIGDAKNVTQVSGMVDQTLFQLPISTLPTSIPNEIEVDISEMEVGESLRVEDLQLPEGVNATEDGQTAIAIALVTRSTLDAMRAEDEAEAEEGEEGAEAAAGRRRRRCRRRWRRRLSPLALRRRTRKEPRTGTPADLLVVGLGNPGDKYEGTRHNVGVEVVHELVDRYGGKLKSSREAALADELRVGEKRVAVAFPQTYMNRSGESVRLLVRRYGIEDFARLVVVHDELDLEPGRLKVKFGGGLAGHNGLKSIRDHIKSVDFVRIRVGVGKAPDRMRGADWVLKRPGKADRALLDDIVESAADATEQLLVEPVDAVMNRFNR